MRPRALLSICLFLITAIVTLGQNNNLYIPRNIQAAFDDGTRSFDGKVTEKYWQNGSIYKIFAEVIPETRELKGIEKITYTNNSPDSLKKFVIRLYQDFYQKGNARDWPINPDAVNDGIDLKSVKINGQTISLQDREKVFRSNTNLTIKLDQPLKSKSTTELEIAWSTIIPNKSQIRMGAYDSTSFFVGYWYPQIAVYDDIDGWDQYSYSGTTEFYNDFSNYEVEITVPEGFVVWATGILQNPEHVLNETILEKFNFAKTCDTIIHIATEEDYKKGIITTQGTGTFRYKADNVSDFTFAMSDHYLWDQTSVIVDSKTDRRVTVAAVYKKESKDFYEVARIARESIKYFSEEMPGLPFPFPELTVFNGSGGMESPMMVNDGSFASESATVGVTSHEIAHSYFPFYMGTNERKYAFMDEGWAQMLPFDFQAQVKNNNVIEHNMEYYAQSAGIETDIPQIVPSTELRAAYRKSAYDRSGAAYYMLKEAIGKEKFQECLHEYIHRWNGKHPIPYDFYFTFNETYGENLNWFWKPWFFEPGYPDLSLDKVIVNNDSISITVSKLGNIPIPVYVKIELESGNSIVIEDSALIWKNGRTTVKYDKKFDRKVKKVTLGNRKIPDSIEENNIVEL